MIKYFALCAFKPPNSSGPRKTQDCRALDSRSPSLGLCFPVCKRGLILTVPDEGAYEQELRCCLQTAPGSVWAPHKHLFSLAAAHGWVTAGWGDMGICLQSCTEVSGRAEVRDQLSAPTEPGSSVPSCCLSRVSISQPQR